MTTQGRRKHNACVFRLRENCPLRKLRKNKSVEPLTHPSPGGGHWTERACISAPAANDSAISVICAPQPSIVSSGCDPCRLMANPDAMETDVVVHPVGSPPTPAPAAVARGPCVRPRNPSEGSSDTSMEFDCGVDPETGERAMG